MNDYRIVIQPQAKADTLANFRWRFDHSPRAAARWLIGLQKAIAKLANNPLRHPIAIEESGRFGFEIRQCLYGKRRGIFRILFLLTR